MVRSVAIQKSRAKIHAGRHASLPPNVSGAANRESIPLIVIQKEKSFIRRRKIRQSARHRSAPFRELMRKSYKPLPAFSSTRRVQRRLFSPNANARDGQRQKKIAVAQRVVIEKVSRVGPEMARFKYPAAIGNRQSEFVLFIPLTMKRQEHESLFDRKLRKRPVYRRQRRRLIESSVKSANDPMQFGPCDRPARSRTRGVLAHSSAEVCQPDTAIQRQPV